MDNLNEQGFELQDLEEVVTPAVGGEHTVAVVVAIIFFIF